MGASGRSELSQIRTKREMKQLSIGSRVTLRTDDANEILAGLYPPNVHSREERRDYFRVARNGSLPVGAPPHTMAWERARAARHGGHLAYVDWKDKPGPASLQTQGLHGIDACGMTGRQPARHSGGQNQNKRRHSEA